MKSFLVCTLSPFVTIVLFLHTRGIFQRTAVTVVINGTGAPTTRPMRSPPSASGAALPRAQDGSEVLAELGIHTH
jgi:hypothetical protein